MSIVSAQIAKLTGQSNTEGINLLKDVLGNEYPVVSAALQGKGLVAIELQLEETAAIAILGPTEGPEFMQELNSGTITKAQWLGAAEVLTNKVLAILGADAQFIADADAFFTSISELANSQAQAGPVT